MNWTEEKLYCVNCSSMIIGYKSKDGLVRMTCKFCGVKTVSKQISRRHYNLDIFAPAVGETTENSNDGAV